MADEFVLQVSNKNANVVFSTAQDFPLYVAETPISSNTNGEVLPDTTTAQIILARPQDGESGVITSQVYQKNEPLTSISTVTMGTGNKTWGHAGSGTYDVGDRVRATANSPAVAYLEGVVSSYTNGVSITINVDEVGNVTGSSSYNDWTINYVTTSDNSKYARYGNTNTFENAFGCANGYKYALASRAYDIYTPSRSGFGLEAYDSTGQNLLYSSDMASVIRIETVVTLPKGSAFKYTNPYGIDFNNLYVDIFSTYFFDSFKYLVSSIFGPNTRQVGGAYTYFDHVNEEIWLCHSAYEYASYSTETWAWNDYLYSTTSNLRSEVTMTIYSILD
jgi:hypothetical protein